MANKKRIFYIVFALLIIGGLLFQLHSLKNSLSNKHPDLVAICIETELNNDVDLNNITDSEKDLLIECCNNQEEAVEKASEIFDYIDNDVSKETQELCYDLILGCSAFSKNKEGYRDYVKMVDCFNEGVDELLNTFKLKKGI